MVRLRCLSRAVSCNRDLRELIIHDSDENSTVSSRSSSFGQTSVSAVLLLMRLICSFEMSCVCVIKLQLHNKVNMMTTENEPEKKWR